MSSMAMDSYWFSSIISTFTPTLLQIPQNLSQNSEEGAQRFHDFWKKYSTKLVRNAIKFGELTKIRK